MRAAAWPLLVAALAFAVTDLPYFAGRRGASAGLRFGGQVSLLDDINMYFSFIRQAADGHWIFLDRLTHLPHAAVFFNPEWLLVGKLMRWTGCSDDVAFEAWRAAGVLALVLGFALLAGVCLPGALARRLALLLFAFGGGFGWISVALRKAGLLSIDAPDRWRELTVDLWLGVHPFFQMMLNPHFSLPHGLVLLVFALFLKGERDGRRLWYGAAGVAALAAGLSRPYDLAALWLILPAFALASPDRFDRGPALRRALPLLITAPALAYEVLLFSFHPVFRSWSRQGEVLPLPVSGHLLSLGLAGVLLAWRLIRRELEPSRRPAERLLLVWTLCIFALVHSRQLAPFLPYSPQFVVPTMAPVVLLGVPALGLPPDGSAGSARGRLVMAGLLVVASAMSSAVLLRQRLDAATHRGYYVRAGELAAYGWLNGHVQETDVILSDRVNGNRLGRYVSARVVLGHYSVTPDAERQEAQVGRFFAGELSPGEAQAYLAQLGVGWIYEPLRDRAPRMRLAAIPGSAKRYQAGGIAVYSFHPGPP